jgi:nucleoside-diphosphate-sugar epimerase
VNQLLITGASGYIGRYLIAGARARKWRVVVATRRRPVVGDVDWIPYALEDEVRADRFPEAAVLVHLAANTAVASKADEEVEVIAAQRLLLVARERRLRFIFVSSQTARPDAPTAYGRAKWRIEQEVRAAGGLIVRPGLVYGGVPAGVFRQLCLLVQGSIFLPALIPPPRVQPIHVIDLAEGILRLAERDDLAQGEYNFADIKPMAFTCVLRAIATARVRRCRVFVPMPVAAVRFALLQGNRWFGSAFDVGRFRSLTSLPLLTTASDLERIALRLRPFSSGMHAPGSDRRRRLVWEGLALLSYVLKQRPPRGLVKRYARAIETLRNGEPVLLPSHAIRFPWSIVLLDSHDLLASAGAHELDWRLDAATLLAEASRAGARRFLNFEASSGVVAVALRTANALGSETLVRTARWLLSPMLRRAVGSPHEPQRSA